GTSVTGRSRSSPTRPSTSRRRSCAAPRPRDGARVLPPAARAAVRLGALLRFRALSARQPSPGVVRTPVTAGPAVEPRPRVPAGPPRRGPSREPRRDEPAARPRRRSGRPRAGGARARTRRGAGPRGAAGSAPGTRRGAAGGWKRERRRRRGPRGGSPAHRAGGGPTDDVVTGLRLPACGRPPLLRPARRAESALLGSPPQPVARETDPLTGVHTPAYRRQYGTQGPDDCGPSRRGHQAPPGRGGSTKGQDDDDVPRRSRRAGSASCGAHARERRGARRRADVLPRELL